MKPSVLVSSCWRAVKLWLALSSGYASATAKRDLSVPVRAFSNPSSPLRKRIPNSRPKGFERAGESILGLRFGLRGRGIHRGAPRLNHLLEGLPLVGGVPLDCLDKIGNQIVAAPQLHIGLRPGTIDEVAKRYQVVVNTNYPEWDATQYCDNDKEFRGYQCLASPASVDALIARAREVVTSFRAGWLAATDRSSSARSSLSFRSPAPVPGRAPAGRTPPRYGATGRRRQVSRKWPMPAPSLSSRHGPPPFLWPLECRGRDRRASRRPYCTPRWPPVRGALHATGHPVFHKGLRCAAPRLCCGKALPLPWFHLARSAS